MPVRHQRGSDWDDVIARYRVRKSAKRVALDLGIPLSRVYAILHRSGEPLQSGGVKPRRKKAPAS